MHYQTIGYLEREEYRPTLALYIAADAQLVQWRPQPRHLHALFWVVQIVAMTLPSALVAWNEPEV